MAKSETILGRRFNRQAFRSNAGRSWFTVSVFPTRHGKLFYTDPVGGYGFRAKPSVLYRIRVYPKKEQHYGQHR